MEKLPVLLLLFFQGLMVTVLTVLGFCAMVIQNPFTEVPMKKITEITCMCCPNRCRVLVDETNGNAVSGNRCHNGEAFAIHELNNPLRQVTASIPIMGAAVDHCPVKSDRAIPTERLGQILAELKELRIEAPVYISQTLATDIAGTGANIIACKTIPKRTD